MPSAITNGARIRTNTAAENAYNALDQSNRSIATHQLRLSTGKRINSASDDVAGYITSRALSARNGSIRAALNAVGGAANVATIAQDGLDNINGLVTQIKEAASSAASGAIGTDEKVALAKAAYRLAEQIQAVLESTVFGGKELLAGSFTSEFVIGSRADNSLLTLAIDLSTSNTDYNLGAPSFDLKLNAASFAGITGLALKSLNEVTNTSLGIFSSANIQTTLQSLANALDNVNKVASYIGGISNRLTSQEDSLKSQMTNYNAAISRIEDADVAMEQLALVKAQFLQQASLTSLAQANQNPQGFLQLIRG
jgi:flagellin